MKGVVLAGGLGTRLYPLTHATNKHLLPVYDRPMVFYPLQTLVRAGITQIMIVVGGPHAGHFMRVLKNGRELGISHLEYAFQEQEGGIAQALNLSRDFAGDEPLAVILGDNTTDTDISVPVTRFSSGACIFLRRVPDPGRFGVPVFSRKGKIIRIEEKPSKPKSDYAVTGLYLYDRQVFSIIDSLRPSARGELEITDVNNAYIRKKELSWQELDGFWIDAGNFDSLHAAGAYWAGQKGAVK